MPVYSRDKRRAWAHSTRYSNSRKGVLRQPNSSLTRLSRSGKCFASKAIRNHHFTYSTITRVVRVSVTGLFPIVIIVNSARIHRKRTPVFGRVPPHIREKPAHRLD